MEFDNIIRLFACVSLVIGAIECFAGFKIMKAMLAIWGLFVGTMIGVIVGVTIDSTVLGFIFVVMLGLGFAILSYSLYSAGIFILTAFLTMVTIYTVSESVLISLLVAVIVGILAMYFVKPVVIISTSVSGAGIILSSAYTIMELGLKTSPVVTVILWVPMALIGIIVQCITTANTKKETSESRSLLRAETFSERKYPGMQRAYRNFCIKCGCEMHSSTSKCSRCGYSYDD